MKTLSKFLEFICLQVGGDPVTHYITKSTCHSMCYQNVQANCGVHKRQGNITILKKGHEMVSGN